MVLYFQRTTGIPSSLVFVIIISYDVLSKKHLLTADSKSQDLTVKKLIKDNPTMKKKFDELKN